jgi:hypothetical protein
VVGKCLHKCLLTAPQPSTFIGRGLHLESSRWVDTCVEGWVWLFVLLKLKREIV